MLIRLGALLIVAGLVLAPPLADFLPARWFAGGHVQGEHEMYRAVAAQDAAAQVDPETVGAALIAGGVVLLGAGWRARRRRQ